jgi:hypothetical protein
MSGNIFQPYFSCPGETCSWEPFTTLGVCGDFYNMTSTLLVNCSGQWTDSGSLIRNDCNYTFPSGDANNSENFTMPMSFAYQSTEGSPPTTPMQSVVAGDPYGLAPGGYVSMCLVRANKNGVLYPETIDPAQTESFLMVWYWCARTYHNASATPAGITGTDYTAERLHYSNSTSVPGMTWPANWYLYNDSAGANYTIIENVDQQLWPYLSRVMNRSVTLVYPHANSNSDQPLDDSIDLAAFLFTGDLANFTSNLADAMTHLIRNSVNGDNVNATTFPGVATITETYVRVRWPWLILPLAATLVTACLLAVSIVLERGAPLLKTSVTALLVHGLEGWDTRELGEMALGKYTGKKGGKETSERLEEMAAGMMARFEEGEDGVMRFVRSEGQEKGE